MRRRTRRSGAEGAPTLTAEQKAGLAQAALVDHRALDPILLDMRELTLVTDYFLICHGTSSVHIRALSDAVQEALAERGVRAYSVEGRDDSRWILLDYGDLIVHVFAEEERDFYDLERLWSDAPRTAASAPG
jgi:ribosome-associated protein